MKAKFGYLLKEKSPAYMNPHVWRRFQVAQVNTIRAIYGRRKRRTILKWANEMHRWFTKMDRYL